MIILNDLHISAARSAGTTPASALALRKYALNQFESMLSQIDEDLVLLGDVFDSYLVNNTDLLETYRLLVAWLNKGRKLLLVIGNHDKSRDSTKLGSFEFLAQLLANNENVTFLEGAGWLDETKGVYAISHCMNQDTYDMHIANVPPCQYLLVHSNFENFYAVQADHSLNMSKEQAEECPAKTIVFAHEHNHRTALSGKVFVCGNQFPMSVSDCLSPQDKFMHRLTDSGVERIKVWDRAENFIDMPWNALTETSAKFIRISGTAKPEEASAATEAVANLRRVSQAFVITNAVQVGTDEELQKASLQSLEAVQAFDVMAALKEVLTTEEYAVIEKL